MFFRKKKTYTFVYDIDSCICKIDAYDRSSALKLFKRQHKYVKNFTMKEDDANDLVHKRHALLSR
jgi:hypothetical protein